MSGQQVKASSWMNRSLAAIAAQHAEEAAFLWLLRDAAVDQPHYALKDLAKLDGRVEGHLDGLRIAGDAGWEVVRDQLAIGEPGEAFAAAAVALPSADKARWDLVLDRVAPLTPPADLTPEVGLARPLVSALAWVDHPNAAQHTRGLLSSPSPRRRRIGLAALVARRQDPGRALEGALEDTDPSLKARALRAIGELGRSDLAYALPAVLSVGEPEVRLWGAWSGALLGVDGAPAALRSLAETPHPRAWDAADMAFRTLPLPESGKWRDALAADPATLRIAALGAGSAGDPAAVPWLLQVMARPELARVAGESLSAITGLDIAAQDLEAQASPDFDTGPTESPEDENVAPDPDEHLPWPDAPAVARWWKAEAHRFPAGKRFLAGSPIADAAGLERTLRKGMQRLRRAAALELVLLRRGLSGPLFPTSARGDTQGTLLGVGRGVLT